MDTDNRKILIAVVFITLLLFPVIAFTTGPLRILLGILFLLFFPGYTLLSTLFPRRNDLGGLERLAMSVGLSIAVVPLIVLMLNYFPWGIRLYPVLITVTLFIMVTSAIGWYRQRKLSEADRFRVTFIIGLPDWTAMKRLDKILSISLVVAVATTLGGLGYFIATPEPVEKYSEFYVLGLEGKAEDYPGVAISGEPVAIVIGVVNHEHRSASYRVGITIDGVANGQVDIGRLDHGEKWEERASFIPQVAGAKQKVEFYLYKGGEAIPYFEDPLHLYIDVVEP